MKVTYKEMDMYNPIRNLLLQHDFIVRGEVKGFDIAAVKGDTLWAVEMKLHPNITLVYQAMDRKMATDWVFVAIPRPKKIRGTFSKFKKLLAKLELGLIVVALDSPLQYAEIVLFPQGNSEKKNKKTVAIKQEVARRTIDSPGGTTKVKINTAYKERSMRIACQLEASGILSPKALVELGCEKDTGTILYRNALGWFAKASKGLYQLSPTGQQYLKDNATESLVIYYRMKAKI